MARGLLARKLGMTQVFDENGNSIPVTVLQAGPCTVTSVRTPEKEKYAALQLGFEEVKLERLSKAQQGHLTKTSGQTQGFRFLKEFRDTGLDATVGQVLKADLFTEGETVKVTGLTKGKGFQGVMKRHGFGGGRASHGSHFHRAPGSLGASSDPSRVFKNTKLPGHTGQIRASSMNLKIVRVNADENLLLVSGAVPGSRTSLVRIEAIG